MPPFMPAVNIVVAPQITTQIGLNLALFSPGAVQTLGQMAGNSLAVGQGAGAPLAAAGGGRR